ncbi:MAG: nicotinate-nucleotide adenylyltransferase [Actinomycetia bacterium]|nr:nicotinate-nucleotide adenylyltransferase [Actinomycetes bacterium]
MAPRERLGILGGTFDPVHIAHLVAGVEASAALALDRTLLVVAPDPWQKRDRTLAPSEVRYSMVEAAVADIPCLESSRLELDRAGPTYTIDTVEALSETDREIFLIAGSDVAARIDTWHRAGELRKMVTLAVVTREGHQPVAPVGWEVAAVAMPRLDVSSSDLRARVAAGRPIDGLIPPAAVRVIRAHGLYTRN